MVRAGFGAIQERVAGLDLPSYKAGVRYASNAVSKCAAVEIEDGNRYIA